MLKQNLLTNCYRSLLRSIMMIGLLSGVLFSFQSKAMAPPCIIPACSISGSTTICAGGSTTLCAPVGMASYRWSTGATTQCITASIAGTYLVTVTATGGCSASCNVTLVNAPSCSITGTTTICPGGSTQLCAISGASSYAWSTGATTRCITVTSVGTYTVTVCVGGCYVTCSKTVTSTSLSCSISGQTNICTGSPTQLCAPAGMSSYSWNTGATTQCINVSSTGTYSVTINNGSCSSNCSKAVTFTTPLNCAISGNLVICPGGSTQLCLPAGYVSYSWNTGATTRCITVTSAGTYYGNVNNGTCNTTCNATVTQSGGTSCSITGNGTICPGGSTQLCATAGMSSYSWSTGATTQCITVNAAGTYSVTCNSGGCSSTCSKTVTVSSPTCSITGQTSACTGSAIQLCAPAGMTSYQWNTGATTQCINVSSTGNYTVTVSNGSCTSSCSKYVTINPPLNCQITGNSTICPGGSTQLCLPAGYVSYSWNTGATTQCITVTSPGTYYGNVNNGTCNSTCNFTVTQSTGSTCSISGNTIICPGGSTQLCAPAGMSSYSWSTGATTQCITVNTGGTYSVTVGNGTCTSYCSITVTVTGNNNCLITGNLVCCSGGTTQLCGPAGMDTYFWSTGATTQCINVGPGNYSLSITSGGCSAICTTTVNITNPPSCIITGNLSICQGGSTQLCGPAGMSSYFWSTGATTQCITVNSAGTYTLTVNSNGCTNTCSATVTIGSVTCNITGGGQLPCGSTVTQLCGPAGMTSYFWSTGATTQCITAGGGTYFLTVTNGACTSNCSTTVTIPSPPPCSITGNLTFCQGGSTQLCGPAGMTSYLWNTGATTQCINVSSAGNYQLTINNNGCTSSCNVQVTVGSTSCNITGGGQLPCGSTFTQLCGPAGMTSYFWSTGATTQCITTGAGTYFLTVTNGSCSSTCSTTVTIPSPPPCSITGNLTFCQGGSTQLCGPAGMTSYLWNTGATTQCINVSSAGTYQLTINNNGCTSSCNVQVTVGSVTCNITGGGQLPCGSTVTQLCGPAGMTSYFWSTGATTQCITAGSGTYFLTVTNGSCSSTCSTTVTIPSPPPCSITGNLTFCQGGSTQLCGPAGMTSYFWSTGATTQCITVNSAGTYALTINNNGCTSNCNVQVSIGSVVCNISGGGQLPCGSTTTLLCGPADMASYFWSTGATTQCISAGAGTYFLTVTNGSCSSTCSTTVTVQNPPPCSITGNLSFCQGSSTQLCGPAGMTSYLWNTGATTQCITVTTPGTYQLTINLNGCTSTCNVQVNVNTATCNISGGGQLACGVTTTQLCGPAGMTSYFWSTGATTQCINAGAGTYFLTVTNGSCSSSCSTAVTLQNPPPCSITGNLSFCQGGSTQLCGPAGMTSYLWITGATTQCITVTTAGTYQLSINLNGCTSTCNVQVTVGSAPCNITGGGQLACGATTTQLCGPAGMTSYFWSTGATTQCITAGAGTYFLSVTNGSCTSTCSTSVTIPSPPPCAITGNLIICTGSSTQLCGPAGMTSYFWSTGATTQCVTVQAGTYSLTISNGTCTSTCSTTVIANNPPTCNITGNSSVCSGLSTQLCASAGMASYLWSTGATTQCINVSSPSTYSVTIIDANGCTNNCNKTVTVNTPPTCSITGNTNICGGGSTSLCATAGMTSYLWSTGSTLQCITVNAAGTYTVTITNSSGCTNSCSQEVTSTNCGISLTKTPSVCEVGQGTVTPVLFTYVVTNNSSSFPASGNIIDNNGTPNNTADDINVCSWGPLAPGASATCTHTFNISSNYTNVAVANGVAGGSNVTATASASVSAVSCLCNIQYPDNSNLPRSGVAFNESEVLVASDPGPMTCGTTGSVIKLWYSDEHAMTLGVRQVNVKTASGTTTTTYPITPGPTPSCVSNPLVGSTIPSGNQSGNDEAAGGGRPLWPALFITDLTVNGANSRAGDWQQGGTGITPSRVCGVWKGALKIVDLTHNPAVVTITPDADPAKNNWNIGGGDVPPGGFAQYQNPGYGAEVSWDVNSLGLLDGHTYRLQFMVHDGDQNKDGGDVGETCTTIHIPVANCASLVNVGNLVWSDVNSNGIKDPSEIGIPGLTVKLYADVNNDNVPDGASIANTSTDGNGIYNFGFLTPGNYIVGVVLPAGATVVPINGGDPDNDIDNDNNALNPSGNEVRSNTVTLGTGLEPTNDGDGNSGNLSVDFAIHSSTTILQKCYVGTSHHYVTASQSWTINTVTNTATIRTTFSKNFVDNTYGTNQIGWPSGHTFGNLTGSDKLTLQLYDVNHVKRMEFAMDYISASNLFPSGYGSLGVTGGDGSITLGSANDVLNVETSLDRNFNDFGYVLTTNSPATNANYTPNASYPNWIYDVWYEVTVNLNVFPGGFGEPVVSGIHASPSKTGQNTEFMNDTTCVFTPRIAAPIADLQNQYNEDNLFVNAYPNPFKGSTTIEFQRSDKTSHIKIEVYTLAGSKVIELFNQEAEAGVTYKTEFNAANLPDGIYIYKMETEDRVVNGKLILMK